MSPAPRRRCESRGLGGRGGAVGGRVREAGWRGGDGMEGMMEGGYGEVRKGGRKGDMER